VKDQDPHEGGIVQASAARPCNLLGQMPRKQLYRLRSRNDREVIREVEPGVVYVDRDTGDEFTVVGKVLPLAPSESRLPWAVENLRLCGCSLEQLAPKDVPDCPTCGRRLPAIED
jgi:tRNA(Ile2) C34 agmatinyltransferase TiaS